MISYQIQNSKCYIDKPLFERELHYLAHDLLYNMENHGHRGFRCDVVEKTITNYLDSKEEVIERKVSCFQDAYLVVLNISFRYDDDSQNWRTMRLKVDPATITSKTPEGYLDTILFGCEIYNG